jgi:hypothetical protein
MKSYDNLNFLLEKYVTIYIYIYGFFVLPGYVRLKYPAGINRQLIIGK